MDNSRWKRLLRGSGEAMQDAVFRVAMRRYSNGDLASEDGLQSAFAEMGSSGDSMVNLSLVAAEGENPLAFHELRNLRAVSLRCDFKYLGEYADQKFIERHVCGQYYQTAKNGAVQFEAINTTVQNVYAVFDRLLLPVGRSGNKLLSVVKTRLVIEGATRTRMQFTSREREILSLLASGLTAKEAAIRLDISPRTIEHRIDAMKARVGARNVTHLVALMMSAEVGG